MDKPWDNGAKRLLDEAAQDFLDWVLQGAFFTGQRSQEFESRPFCERHNCEMIVMNGDTLSPEQEMVHDLIAIVTVFSSRLYGLRSYKKVMKDAALHKGQA